MQVRGRGSLTLPARMRERYGLEDGDPMTLVDLDGVMVLSPKVGIVAKLAAEVHRLKTEAGLTTDALIAGLAQPRRTLPRKRP